MTDTAEDTAAIAAVEKVAKLLTPLKQDDRVRVLRSVAILLGVKLQ